MADEEDTQSTGGGYDSYGSDIFEDGGTGLAIDEYGEDDFDYDDYNSFSGGDDPEYKIGKVKRGKGYQITELEPQTQLGVAKEVDDDGNEVDPENDPTGASDFDPLKKEAEEKAAEEEKKDEEENEQQTLRQRARNWVKKNFTLPPKKEKTPLDVKWIAVNYVKYRHHPTIKPMLDQLNVAFYNGLASISLAFDKLIGVIHQKYLVPQFSLDAMLEIYGIIDGDIHRDPCPSLTWQLLGPLWLSTTGFMVEQMKSQIDAVLALPGVKDYGFKVTEAVEKTLGDKGDAAKRA